MYKPIIGTLGYVLSPDRDKVLLIHRNARPDDQHFGKYNGLGGKALSGEDMLSCLTREIREEAGIECEGALLRGIINWPGFGSKGEDWLGFIFLVTDFTGIPYLSNNEGELCWHPLETFPELPMWEGDRYFLPLVFDDDPRIFYGWMPYENGRPVTWNYRRS
jgi:8-oxo-dGTP diphosphatase